MLSVFEKVLLLQDLEFLSLVHTEHLTEFATLCGVVEAGKGSILFRREEACPSLYLLVQGRVTLERETGEIETVEEDVLGCWSFFSQSPHQYTARTIEECTLLTISFSEFTELLTAEPEFCWAVTRYLAKRGYRARSG